MDERKDCPRCYRALVRMAAGWRCVGCSRPPNTCDCPADCNARPAFQGAF